MLCTLLCTSKSSGRKLERVVRLDGDVHASLAVSAGGFDVVVVNFNFLDQGDAVREVKFGPEDIMYICNTLLFDCTVESLLDDEIGDAYKIADQQRSGGNSTSKAHLKPIRPTCRCKWNDEKRVQEVAELVRTNIADQERNVVYRMNVYQLTATSAFTSTST